MEDYKESREDVVGENNHREGRCPFLGENELASDTRQFHVIDEVDHESDSQMSDTDSDVPDDEVERMLEDALNNKKRKADEAQLDGDSDKPFEEKDKVVLIKKEQDHFDTLPEGWIQVTHNSGMPLYLHKSSRVCTFAKPYFLGSGSVRKHEVPTSAVPCLGYRKALEEEAEKSKSQASTDLPNARIETAKENNILHDLSPAQLQEYCEKLFQFRNIKVMRFKSWSQRRQFNKKKKQEKQLQRPTLPDALKMDHM